VLARLRSLVRSSAALPGEVLDPAPCCSTSCGLFKTPHELSVMRRAVAITAEAHRAAMAAATPGMGENEIDALLTYTFLRRGASGAAYGNHRRGRGQRLHPALRETTTAPCATGNSC
jgi:Xaa-Pro aminopeptidase